MTIKHRWRGEVTGFDWFRDANDKPYKKFYAELKSLDGYPIPTWAYLDEHGIPITDAHLGSRCDIIGFKFIWTIGRDVDHVQSLG